MEDTMMNTVDNMSCAAMIQMVHMAAAGSETSRTYQMRLILKYAFSLRST
jgi:hypothetical protein